ncbi:molybdenum cofactor guanylyltransferase [Sphingomonas bacterium]|uniref:molybdenum cofactor guanylyltransferase n=1 Tax=Sphingomonas bacterium TaxID=1895847 RepID=UPI0015768E0F|nr:molybdenum cofactor guanylyltransferase [Sphingomonas bacterium]
MTGRVLGAVLVGGASSRFGSDKAAAMWAGATLADHAAVAITPFVAEVVRIGGDGLPDLPRAGLGPLGGIAAALDHAGRRGFHSVLTIACDMPTLPDGLVEALLRRAPACCADAPVLGHWPAGLADALIGRLASSTPSCEAPGRHLRNATLSIRRWAENIGALPIRSPVPLANVNTPADLLAL